VLEIHLRGSDSPIMCSAGLESLLHDVRVVQGVPFLELAGGDLVNLTEVTRIIEQRELDTSAPCDGFEQPGHVPCARPAGHEGRHWGREDGPMLAHNQRLEAMLAEVADVEAQQLPDPLPTASGTGYPNPMLGRVYQDYPAEDDE
jgi:hypothetical protein